MPFDTCPPAPSRCTTVPPVRPETPVLSVVVPFYNEADNVADVLRETAAAVRPLGACEILCVDDGSRDDTAARISAFRTDGVDVRLIRHVRNLGQSAALRSGILAARAPLVVTMDGDGQNDPGDIRRLWHAWRENAAIAGAPPPGMVGGVRTRRRDSVARRAASRIANAVRRSALQDGAQDTGCALRLMRRDAFLSIPHFDHLHRFLPAMMMAAGYGVRFLPVGHRPRARGVSKYGNLRRLIEGLVDLPGVIWLRRRYRYFPACAEEIVFDKRTGDPDE